MALPLILVLLVQLVLLAQQDELVPRAGRGRLALLVPQVSQAQQAGLVALVLLV